MQVFGPAYTQALACHRPLLCAGRFTHTRALPLCSGLRRLMGYVRLSGNTYPARVPSARIGTIPPVSPRKARYCRSCPTTAVSNKTSTRIGYEDIAVALRHNPGPKSNTHDIGRRPSTLLPARFPTLEPWSPIQRRYSLALRRRVPRATRLKSSCTMAGRYQTSSGSTMWFLPSSLTCWRC